MKSDGKSPKPKTKSVVKRRRKEKMNLSSPNIIIAMNHEHRYLKRDKSKNKFVPEKDNKSFMNKEINLRKTKMNKTLSQKDIKEGPKEDLEKTKVEIQELMEEYDALQNKYRQLQNFDNKKIKGLVTSQALNITPSKFNLNLSKTKRQTQSKMNKTITSKSKLLLSQSSHPLIIFKQPKTQRRTRNKIPHSVERKDFLIQTTFDVSSIKSNNRLKINTNLSRSSVSINFLGDSTKREKGNTVNKSMTKNVGNRLDKEYWKSIFQKEKADLLKKRADSVELLRKESSSKKQSESQKIDLNKVSKTQYKAPKKQLYTINQYKYNNKISRNRSKPSKTTRNETFIRSSMLEENKTRDRSFMNSVLMPRNSRDNTETMKSSRIEGQMKKGLTTEKSRKSTRNGAAGSIMQYKSLSGTKDVVEQNNSIHSSKYLSGYLSQFQTNTINNNIKFISSIIMILKKYQKAYLINKLSSLFSELKITKYFNKYLKRKIYLSPIKETFYAMLRTKMNNLFKESLYTRKRGELEEYEGVLNKMQKIAKETKDIENNLKQFSFSVGSLNI